MEVVRVVIGLSFMISLGFPLACSNTAGPVAAPDLDYTKLSGKKILFVYGGWEGHNPVATRDLYVPWLISVGAEVIMSDSVEIYRDSVLMDGIDLVIQIWTMGKISGEAVKGLQKAVENGTGLAGWHGGIVDAFISAQGYHLMTGGQFLAHPGGIIPYHVNITNHTDPITRDVSDFDVQTEQYYMLVDPNVEVLATTTFSSEHLYWLEGRTMPVLWKNTYGQGKVFVTTLGHKMEDHAIPQFETTFRRGLVWACRE